MKILASIVLSALLVVPLNAFAQNRTVRVKVTNNDRVEADVCIEGKYNTTARCELHQGPGKSSTFVASLSPDGKYDVVVRATFLVLPEDPRTSNSLSPNYRPPAPGGRSAVKIVKCKTVQGAVSGPVQTGDLNLPIVVAHDLGSGC
jgi:hypothetical protein